MADDNEVKSNIWYNISYVFVTTGQYEMAELALKMAIEADSHNYEALNNLGVLSLKNGK